ncbi:glycine cleavage system aminomethyltransferase GcvT [Caldichromatium japonicum]|uniref:Aminomethyltransferase n=1 Tax=Caldichromatium japonicum TaxID=2699430 RepID=A0A6G7VCB5_9GAMM|nr:glycine cleavage system aminomethyltransferase GcvT [Caldichromatium japonicum]QIK37550.1 glycine cleavage system aminomethyltransferase GcvT [Caldichromatium japonicum]
MALRTPLYPEHHKLNARLVPFAGWEMPLHYGSQLEEHQAVRRHAGMFDVSHMGQIDVEGPDAKAFLRTLLANDVAKLNAVGKALYTCMLDERGGILDDLIVYLRGPGTYRLVVNAATTAKDLAWLNDQAEGDLEIRRRDDLAMIAVQGPKARALTLDCLPPELSGFAAELAPFTATQCGPWLIGRTGYTGEDGFEIMLPATDALDLWQILHAAGIRPCGLGARDTLRLEAGLNLYGQDMDETTTPFDCGLEWTIAWEPTERAFIGRAALEAQRDAPRRWTFIGLVLLGEGIMRAGQPVLSQGQAVGVITSGGFAPTLNRSIALARVVPGLDPDCVVEIRGKTLPMRIVKPPFVRHGQILVDLKTPTSGF